ncbi:MAG: hypothetical protein WD645_02390 [Dehalococcoidia bacterium]
MENFDIMGLAFGLTVLIGGMIVVMVVIWQVFATARAKMSVAREEAYQKLAEQATQEQARLADWMEKAGSDLADLRRRLAEMERMLKEVG